VVVLASDKCPVSGKTYEVGAGWMSEVRI